MSDDREKGQESTSPDETSFDYQSSLDQAQLPGRPAESLYEQSRGYKDGELKAELKANEDQAKDAELVKDPEIDQEII